LEDLTMTLKHFISCTVCAALAVVLSGAALAQVPITRPDQVWKAPDRARVQVNKVTGRISILMPSEIDGRATVDRNFTAWRKTPFAGTGPMPATRVEDPSLPTHTLYHPRVIAGRLPVVLWANGGCRNTSVEFTKFLGELASRGYFVIAIGRNDVWFSEFDGSDPVIAAGQPPLTTRGGEPVIAGLDWATKENARAGSPYFNKLDLAHVAALGQSCGGGQVWQAAKDPRIKAVAAMNSNFPTATGGGIGGGPPPADGWTVEKLTIPAAFFIGGPGDVAYTLSNATYAATPASAQVIKANLPEAGHYGAYPMPLPEWVTAVSGWLDWQLKGDAKAKALFAGADCGLCRNPAWWYESKNVN
jgi:dienelactone hydrolase